MDQAKTITKDKIKGMLAAHFLGDALGAPYEFYKWNRDRVYTDDLTLEPYRRNTMYGRDIETRHPVGSVTDDTQMSIALINSLIECGEYNEVNVVESYAKWAHSGNTGMGNNTRYLFTNKTYKGYLSRVKKLNGELEAGTKTISLSNGALMRCSPFAVFSDDKWLIQDCNLTNPNLQNIETNQLYCKVLRSLLLGGTVEQAKEIVVQSKEWITDKELLKCVNQVLKNKNRDIGGKDKGLALHALWCALTGLFKGLNYEETMRWVITMGSEHGVGDRAASYSAYPQGCGIGDTDTNAAITGALIGASLGWKELMKSKTTRINWKILHTTANSNNTDLKEFLPTDLDRLVNNLYKLSN